MATIGTLFILWALFMGVFWAGFTVANEEGIEAQYHGNDTITLDNSTHTETIDLDRVTRNATSQVKNDGPAVSLFASAGSAPVMFVLYTGLELGIGAGSATAPLSASAVKSLMTLSIVLPAVYAVREELVTVAEYVRGYV